MAFLSACILYKPAGQHCKVVDQDEYDRAIADGWSETVPKDWNNMPDPEHPGATLPLPMVSPVPAAPAEKAAKADKAEPVHKTGKGDK